MQNALVSPFDLPAPPLPRGGMGVLKGGGLGRPRGETKAFCTLAPTYLDLPTLDQNYHTPQHSTCKTSVGGVEIKISL